MRRDGPRRDGTARPSIEGPALRRRQPVHLDPLHRAPRRRWAVGDSYDNAWRNRHRPLKSELIRGPRQGPWDSAADVELATLGWGGSGCLGDVPPAEFEAAYAALQPDHQTRPSRIDTRACRTWWQRCAAAPARSSRVSGRVAERSLDAGTLRSQDRDLLSLSEAQIPTTNRPKIHRRHPATLPEPPTARGLGHPDRERGLLAGNPRRDHRPELPLDLSAQRRRARRLHRRPARQLLHPPSGPSHEHLRCRGVATTS